jgi:Type I restriction modification DNA specificity domain
MKVQELIDRYSSAKPINLVDKAEWLEEQLLKSSGHDLVLKLANKHIFGPRSERLREILFLSGRVVCVWQAFDGAYILIGPERVGAVYFVFDDLIATYYQTKRWSIRLNSVYDRPLGGLRYKHRIDFEYNNPKYDEFEKELLYHPTIAEVTKYIRYGYHANPTKEKEVLRKYMEDPSSRHEASALRKYAADLKEKTGEEVDVEPRIGFLGITNISPHGYIVGDMETKTPDVLPDSSKLREGDIVVSLFGGNFQKHTLGSIGKVAVVDKGHVPCFINQTMCSLRAKDDIDSYFLLASIRSEYFRRQMQMRMKPSNRTQTLISLDDFSECRVKIPSKAVMKAIGDRYRELMDAFRDEQTILDEVESL